MKLKINNIKKSAPEPNKKILYVGNIGLIEGVFVRVLSKGVGEAMLPDGKTDKFTYWTDAP